MNTETLNVRILEHEKGTDIIRIGPAFPIAPNEIHAAVESVKKQYAQKLEWKGGFLPGCREYYKRISIIGAETLCNIVTVWGGADLTEDEAVLMDSIRELAKSSDNGKMVNYSDLYSYLWTHDTPHLTESELKGYLGSLVKKGWLDKIDTYYDFEILK